MWEKDGLTRRSVRNPILQAQTQHWWESKLVYNAAALRLDDRVYLLYRAMGGDHLSRFGLAVSPDGVEFTRLSYPVFFARTEYEIPHPERLEQERERGGVEDPRAIVVGDTIYVIYTALHKMCHLAMARMTVNRFRELVRQSEGCPGADLSAEWNSAWERIGLVFPHLFEVPELFSRNSTILPLQKDLFLLFYRIHKGDILVSLSNSPEGPWKDKEISFLTKKLPWEAERIGISTPAIPVSQNGDVKYLFFYHGVEEQVVNEAIVKTYHLGAFFLSAAVEAEEVVLTSERLERPVLSPERDYELDNEWLLSVGVHAVFSCGAVPVDDDEIYIYYGSGDSNINLGKVSVRDLFGEKKLTERCVVDRSLF